MSHHTQKEKNRKSFGGGPRFQRRRLVSILASPSATAIFHQAIIGEPGLFQAAAILAQTAAILIQTTSVLIESAAILVEPTAIALSVDRSANHSQDEGKQSENAKDLQANKI